MKSEEKPYIVSLEGNFDKIEMKWNSIVATVDICYGLLLMELKTSVLLPYSKGLKQLKILSKLQKKLL